MISASSQLLRRKNTGDAQAAEVADVPAAERGRASVIVVGTSSSSDATVSNSGYGRRKGLQEMTTQTAPSHQPTRTNQATRVTVEKGSVRRSIQPGGR